MANIAKEEEGEKKRKAAETRMREEGIKIKRRRF